MEEKIEKKEEHVSYMQEYKYGDHDLQRISLFQPPPKRTEPQHTDALWIIYIHGGAWRDPNITERSFDHTVDILLSGRWIHKIKGFASISYRLSPHPDHKQLSPISKNSAQEAKHPDHINDVLMGLTYLQKNFGVKDKYVLVGHSCGATLAFQTLWSKQFDYAGFVKPRIIVGVAGIYDLRGLRDRHPNSGYEEFISGAFGTDEEVWDMVSPINLSLAENPWCDANMVVLVSSPSDEFIDSQQIDEFEKALKKFFSGVTLRAYLRVETWRRILNCSHDDIWKKD
ncbi:hypothetical protein EPUL_005484, partial [Erysiphe pulchra]